MNGTKKLFQKFLRERIYAYRINSSLSQENMANILHVSLRAYSDQEHSKFGFSAISFTYYILLLSDEEVLQLIKELRLLLEECTHE